MSFRKSTSCKILWIQVSAGFFFLLLFNLSSYFWTAVQLGKLQHEHDIVEQYTTRERQSRAIEWSVRVKSSFFLNGVAMFWWKGEGVDCISFKKLKTWVNAQCTCTDTFRYLCANNTLNRTRIYLHMIYFGVGVPPACKPPDGYATTFPPRWTSFIGIVHGWRDMLKEVG